MNYYGEIAMRHWARWLPSQYAAIEDPDSFFSDLGSRAEHRIADLAYQFAGDDQPGEGYLGKVGRLAEMILLEPEPGADKEEQDSLGS